MRKILRKFLWMALILFVLLNFISATNAYKFTHFYDRGSKIERPDYKESGWDKAGDILFGKDYFKKENIQMPDSFSSVIIPSTNQIKLAGWYRTVGNAKGSVALFHGYGDNKSKLLPEAMGFLDMGFNVLLIDFRAHGNSSGNTCTIGYKEADDVRAAYNFLKNKGENNIILWGISMGAASVAHAMEEYHLKPSKIILEMPFATMKDAVEGQLNSMHLPEEPFGVLLTFWGGLENGFWAFSADPDNYVKDIHCPVLLQQGAHDIRVKPIETKEIYHNLNQPKQLVMYNNSGHESLCKKEHLKWLASVSAFLNS
jgi:uncharacterized protein